MLKPLAITLGDPAGIGPEVVLKALQGLDLPVVLFGSRSFTECAGALPGGSDFVDVGGAGKVRFGEVHAEYGAIALRSIEAALESIREGRCSALVTAPIQKQSIAAAGSPYPGHTELLAAAAGLKRYGYDYAMYFDSPSIRTVLLSVHVSLRKAIESINADTIAALAILTSREFDRLYGFRPKIAAAGVNPHAGDGGLFGEEELVVARGVALARERGIEITGPHPADTVFLAATQRRYDVVMAMYHDQGLIPVKTMDFASSVNVTIGLPYLRCSVDHGTAFDIAGKGIADPAPMRYAIEWASRHATRFTEVPA